MTAPLGGSCDQRFAAVRDRFAASLADGSETGAAVCVYADGEAVVDLWGGWADAARTRPWSHDTIVATYSVTKAFAAVALLSVVERGLIGLDEPVVSVWPEYATGGKDETTVRHLLSHRAGLPAFPDPRDAPAWGDWTDLTQMLAAASPEWEPGTAHAEHALTYGHLLGEVARRVDGRSLGRILREDVAGPLGLDFQVGLTGEEVGRVAELEYSSPSWPRDSVGKPGSLWERALSNPAGARDLAVLNSALWWRSEIPAVNGHGTARSVARLYAALGRQLGESSMSPWLRTALLTPVATGQDALLEREVTWGLGVQFDESYVGMAGTGGSDGLVDLARGYAFGYVTRRLGTHDRAIALTETVEACLG